jgi:hypothetical protein
MLVYILPFLGLLEDFGIACAKCIAHHDPKRKNTSSIKHHMPCQIPIALLI